MKKLVVFILEEVGYLSLLAYGIYRYPKYMEGVSIIAVFVIPALSIAAATMIQFLLRKIEREKLIKQFRGVNQWLYSMITFCLIFTTFFVSYVALEYFGNMPASFRTLFLISILSTLAHMMISSMPGMTSRMDKLLQVDEDEYEN
ncbi:MAG: hypothetical protein HUJ76_09655 [Parasporobacterium sp.]|nr:hypothetical protein [Parasporobacterium sp.]